MSSLSQRRRSRALGLIALASSPLVLGGLKAPNAGLTLTGPMSSPLAPGETSIVTANGGAGNYVLFMIDVEEGTTSLPYAGGFQIGLAQTSEFVALYRVIPASGTTSVECTLDCNDATLWGVEFYAQAAALDPNTKEICVSNIVSFEWDDSGNSCGFEGCTPGYWRQTKHYEAWTNYSPDMAFSAVFDDAFPGMTLGQVVELGGGGLDALGRHTVAALLNGSSPLVSYPVSDADVIAMFNAVYPEKPSEFEDLKDKFDTWNNYGCGLSDRRDR